MRKGVMTLEQLVFMILILVIGCIVLWGMYHLLSTGTERGLAGIFG
jgi:hypothetical protein